MENLTSKVYICVYLEGISVWTFLSTCPVQLQRDTVETTAASRSVEIRLHSSMSQVDATIVDKHLVATGYDQSGLPKVTNYVAYEQYYDSAEWTGQTRGIHVIVLDQNTVS